jgi:hypothetical protein
MGDLFSADIKNPTAVRLFERLSGAEGIKADAKSRQNIANFNAQVADQEATAKRQATKFAQKRQAEEAERIKGRQKVAIAKAGGIGSPVAEDLMAGQAAELELENILLGFEGEVAATQAERQGALDIAGGKAARRRGTAAKKAKNIQAGTTLLQGFN